MEPTEAFSWYAFIRDFQTSFIGLIGFMGVAWTLRSNARLAREQIAAQADEAMRQHVRDIDLRRRLVRKGVLVELRAAKTKLIMNIDSFEKGPGNTGKFAQLLPELVVTHELIREIGLLTDLEISSIAGAYEGIDSLRDMLTSADDSRSLTKSVSIDARWAKNVFATTKSVAGNVATAIEAIQKSDALASPHSENA